MRKKLTAEDISMYDRIRKDIRNARLSMKMSQRELAELLNVTDQYISQIENGRRNPELPMIRRIYSILNIPGIVFDDTVPTVPWNDLIKIRNDFDTLLEKNRYSSKKPQ